MYIRNLSGDEYALQATTTHEEGLEGNQSLEFTIAPNKVNDLFISDVAEMWTVVDFKEVEYKIIYVKRKGEGNKLTVDVKAIPMFYDFMDNNRMYDRTDGSMTAFAAFTLIFKDTGYNFSLTDAFTAVTWQNFGGGEAKLKTFKDALNRYKAEFRIEGNTVFLSTQIGDDTSNQYRYRLNASNIIQEVDAGEMWTYAKGFGNFESGEDDPIKNAGLKKFYRSPIADLIEERHAPPIIDGRRKNGPELIAALKELVDSSLKVSVSATIHELNKQKYPVTRSNLGDRVFLIDERIGLNWEVRVIKQSITRDWTGKVLDVNITFGSEGLGKRYQANINTAVSTITNALSGRKPIPMSMLDQRVKDISEIINGNVDSVFEYMPNGIRGWNGDNPNYMTRYVGDAIGFSKDGGATYGTAMSAELGIVADYITTGTLRAIIIDGVEIYGSKFVSELSPKVFTKIENARVEARGSYWRNWRGVRELEDVSLRMEDGQFRARNNVKNWSVYYNDYGISTFSDGDGGSENNASGIIEFHSSEYSPTNSKTGLTLLSLAGVIGIETAGGRIYLNPSGASVRVSDVNDNYYNIAAGAFNQSSRTIQKRNIKPLQDDALKLINSLDIKEYKRLTSGESTILDSWQAGILVEEAPSELLADGDSVDIYSYLNYVARALQQLSASVDEIKGV